MTRTRAFAAAAALVLSGVAFAQDIPNTPPPASQTTVSSSGTASNRDSGVTTGSAPLGSGEAKTQPATNDKAVIQTEDKIIDGKVKGICRGC